MVGGAPRGTVACGGYGGELCLRDPRSKMRAEVNLSSPAHSAGVQSIVSYFYLRNISVTVRAIGLTSPVLCITGCRRR